MAVFFCRFAVVEFAGFPDVGDEAAVLGVEAGTMRETSSWRWFSMVFLGLPMENHGKPMAFRRMISKSWP